MSELVPTATVDGLLASGEPAARWIALTRLLDRDSGDPDVVAAHKDVLAHPGTLDLIERLGDWDKPAPLSGHASAAYAPNLLRLLADFGVGPGDHPRVDAAVAALTHHADDEGRLATPSVINRISPEPVLSALLCDSHAIVEVLVRFGKGDDPAVQRALDRMAEDLAPTAQGMAWPCVPSLGFRGPGRKGDACPQVTLEALRIIALLGWDRSPVPPKDVLAAGRTALLFWSQRSTEKPYMFGHGIAFKTIKWPPFWYGDLAVLEAIGRFPELWEPGTGEARAEDRTAVTELAACLIAYNIGSDGWVKPRSCYRGFEDFSFGQKKIPSPYATARILSALKPFEPLTSEIARADVLTLASSKGGSGRARAPRP